MIKAAQPAPDLSWVHEITSHPHWPQMEALLFQEVPTLLNDSLAVSAGMDSKAAGRIRGTLQACGLSLPKTHEEELRVYIALRAVLGYLTKKKEQIEMLKKAHTTNVQRGLEDGTLSRESQTTLRGN